jgi:flagellar motor switch protein FliM
MLLEGVIGKLSGETWMAAQRISTHETKKLIEKEITPLNVKLQAIIGEAGITIRDLLQLQKGDVLCLDKPVKEDLLLQVGGKNKIACRPGLVGRKKAVQVTRIIEKEVEGAS